ncbi:hypothetical protein ACFQZV_10680 [Microbacterium koreense]|uniref:Uncharacterized protein n=1 Tax=Microbacterium koreense TaxID=323761 RepID=A0ABW2ZSX5_9MICO
MTDQQDQPYATDGDVVEEVEAVEESTSTDEAPQYGVGPFSVREVGLAGIWLVAFVVSFFPVGLAVDLAFGNLVFGFGTVWSSGLGWILPIGLPTVAVFLLALRRLSPDGIRRVGSLGIDQFASVAFSVAALVWLQLVWETVAVSIVGGFWLRSWVIWVELVLMLAAVVLTVFAPLIPPFKDDFHGRREIVAHRNARPVRAISPRPAREPRPVVDEPSEESPQGVEDDAMSTTTIDVHPDPYAPAQARDTYEPVELHETTPVVRHQAFWALVPEERDIVDENGIALFRIGPTAWALVIEDHGERFVVRHEDGRVGYLHDVQGVTRG